MVNLCSEDESERCPCKNGGIDLHSLMSSDMNQQLVRVAVSGRCDPCLVTVSRCGHVRQRVWDVMTSVDTSV